MIAVKLRALPAIPEAPHYLTAGGVTVQIGTPEFRDGKWRAPAYRLTGGFHGWLKTENLRLK